MASRSLLVRILGDDKSVRAAFERSSASAQTFGKSVTGAAAGADKAFTRISRLAAGGLVGGIAAGAAIRGIQDLTGAASDLNEQINKSEQVFGDNADAVLRWSRTTADSLGISQRAALEASGTFGNLFTAIGIGGPQAAETSRRLVQLASDLASFNNANPADVLEALRSGLTGEQEPLRKYGVLLSEARVQQEALAQTGKDNAKQLTNQEKAAARIAIIFRDTAKAQGDFSRTSGGLANQQRILQARFEDLRAELGTNLLPVMIKVTEAANKMLGSFSNRREPALLNSPRFRQQIADAFGLDTLRDFLAKAGPELDRLQAEFERTVSPWNVPIDVILHPKVTVDQQGVKGFGTGLKPSDLFGTLVTELPNRLREALLDAQNKTPNLLADDLAALERQKRALERALEDPRLKVGQRVKLKGDLQSVLNAIDGIHKQMQQAVEDATSKSKQAAEDAAAAADRAKQAQRDAFDRLFANLQLRFDRAKITASFADDLAAVKVLQDAVRRQIAVEGRTPELLRTLFQLRRDAADITGQQRQALQFRALGLTAEGSQVVPGVANLRKQLSQLTSRLVDEGEMTPKIRSQLQRIGKVLSGEFGKVTETTRGKVRDMFREIRQVFGEETNKGLGQDIRRVTLSDKILAALGFGKDPDVIRANSLGNAARSLSVSSGAISRASFGNAAASGGVTITGPITVVADNPDAFLRELQKKAGRTSATARGRFPGRSLGLG